MDRAESYRHVEGPGSPSRHQSWCMLYEEGCGCDLAVLSSEHLESGQFPALSLDITQPANPSFVNLVQSSTMETISIALACAGARDKQLICIGSSRRPRSDFVS